MILPLLLAAALQCSERISWEPTPGALWYEVHRSYRTAILRRVVDEGVVWSSKGRIETTYAPDGSVASTRDASLDCVWSPRYTDQTPKQEWASRRPYTYAVLACNAAGCSAIATAERIEGR